MNKENKLTEYELMKRLDNEFSDLDFSMNDCSTKGVVSIVYFYEKKINMEEILQRLESEE